MVLNSLRTSHHLRVVSMSPAVSRYRSSQWEGKVTAVTLVWWQRTGGALEATLEDGEDRETICGEWALRTIATGPRAMSAGIPKPGDTPESRLRTLERLSQSKKFPSLPPDANKTVQHARQQRSQKKKRRKAYSDTCNLTWVVRLEADAFNAP
jgi:hypothetical protein